MFTDVRRFATIDSTNRYLMEEARNGAAHGVVVVADHQSAGRGRLGRTWEAPNGANILLSVLLRLAPGQQHLANGAVALAALDAIDSAELVPSGTFGIKWPNDLVNQNGEKLGGVLAEADGDAVVVGIGLNVNWPVDPRPDALAHATSLARETGGAVDREALIEALVAALPRWVELIPSGVAAAVGDRCLTIGQQVRIDLVDGTSFTGLAREITPEGHLVVGDRTVVVGDVHHLRPDEGSPRSL